jgi:hypothetical protein
VDAHFFSSVSVAVAAHRLNNDVDDHFPMIAQTESPGGARPSPIHEKYLIVW